MGQGGFRRSTNLCRSHRSAQDCYPVVLLPNFYPEVLPYRHLRAHGARRLGSGDGTDHRRPYLQTHRTHVGQEHQGLLLQHRCLLPLGSPNIHLHRCRDFDSSSTGCLVGADIDQEQDHTDSYVFGWRCVCHRTDCNMPTSLTVYQWLVGFDHTYGRLLSAQPIG